MREKYITCNFHIMNKIRICEFLVSQTMIDCESENLTHERSVSLLPFFFFFNWDSPHARLNSHYEAWSYKKRSTKRITGYRKSV